MRCVKNLVLKGYVRRCYTYEKIVPIYDYPVRHRLFLEFLQIGLLYYETR